MTDAWHGAQDNGFCGQPCGECRSCRRDKRNRVEVRRLRAEMRRVRTLLARAVQAIEGELMSAGPDEVRQHPTLSANARVASAARRFLAKGGAR